MGGGVTDAELERRKAICRACKNLKHRGGIVWCANRQRRPDGKYCEPWAASQYRKQLLDMEGCPKWQRAIMNAPFPPLPENPQDGVLIVSIGSNRRQWLFNAIASVRRHRPDLGIHVVSDVPVDVPFTWVSSAHKGRASRVYKTRPHLYTPFPGVTMQMDDDAVMHRPLPPFLDLLAGNDLALVRDSWWPTIGHAMRSPKTHPHWTSKDDLDATAAVCSPDDAHHNSGVILFRNTPAVVELFDRWYEEWQRFRRCDQMPLCRALAATGIPVTRLDQAYNSITSKYGFDTNPFVMHFTHKQHTNKYHPRFAPQAERHARYRAFSRAVDKGQQTREQYEAAGKPLWNRCPCRLLVWGCGQDSTFWRTLNRDGRTLFVEHDPKWASMARADGCDVLEAALPSSHGTQAAASIERPAGLDREWDAIIIDGPPGHSARCAGRELPIRWAAESGAELIVVHDYDRAWERACCDRYLGPPRHVQAGRGLLAVWSASPIADALSR